MTGKTKEGVGNKGSPEARDEKDKDGDEEEDEEAMDGADSETGVGGGDVSREE